MTIPEGFLFSQGNMQDFTDCRRRFQLRYLKQLAWPAVESEPVLENERYMQQGQRFHQMVHQHLLGLPAEMLTRQIHNDDLQRWWDNYLRFAPQLVTNTPGQAGLRWPEFSLSAALDGFRLVAQCDLIVALPQGRLRIVDWKTARKRPKRAWLAARLQTRLYPYLLARAGAAFNGGQPVSPDNVEMIYWFADFPENPERFEYNLQSYQKDEAYLKGLLAALQRLDEHEFERTNDEKRCAFCTYRSLCERGVRAGSLEDLDLPGEAAEALLDIDFEQIAEIEY